MFESVLERNLPPRQLGRGAGLAIGVHAVVIAAAMYLSARPAPAVEKQIRALTVFTQPSRIAQPGPASPGGESSPTKPRAERRTWRAIPTDVDKSQRHTTEPSSSAATGESSHSTGGNALTTEGTGTAGHGEGTGTGVGGNTTIAIPFGEGMTRPAPIVQPPPVYTREASAAHAQGTVSVRCTITVEGTLKDCRVLKGVPFMDGAVLDALSRWRYSPVTFQGRPVSVYYAINLRLVAP